MISGIQIHIRHIFVAANSNHTYLRLKIPPYNINFNLKFYQTNSDLKYILYPHMILFTLKTIILLNFYWSKKEIVYSQIDVLCLS